MSIFDNLNNICILSDSYKLGSHWNMYPEGTEYVYSYFEARSGALFPKITFFGLQYILKELLEGPVVTQEKIDEAEVLCIAHFGNKSSFPRDKWEYILNKYNGYLPILIKAVPEGTEVGINNVLMTVVNTDPNCAWLTSYLETVLSNIWYSCSVASLSREVKKIIIPFLEETADFQGLSKFMLHDFGMRSTSGIQQSAIGGLAHLVHWMGTDTPVSLLLSKYAYSSDMNNIAFSVPATEHSIMTAMGREGEEKVVEDLLNKYPTGILSLVADSYNIYNFVENIVCNKFKNTILEREGVFVIRPDSCSERHPTPESQVLWIVQKLWDKLGGTIVKDKFKLINDKVRVLWGDGLSLVEIKNILQTLKDNGFSSGNIATFGMGSGLLYSSKKLPISRDTWRFAFKSSAQCRIGVWHDIFKDPLDKSKSSKKGKLKLVKTTKDYCPEGYNIGEYITLNQSTWLKDELVTVFQNGQLTNNLTFEQIRINAGF